MLGRKKVLYSSIEIQWTQDLPSVLVYCGMVVFILPVRLFDELRGEVRFYWLQILGVSLIQLQNMVDKSKRYDLARKNHYLLIYTI